MAKTLQELIDDLGSENVDALVTEYVMLKMAKANKFDELVEALESKNVTVERLREMV
jgi:hypothetical protein